MSATRTLRLGVVAIVVGIFALVASSSTVSRWLVARLPEYSPILSRLPQYEGQSGNPDPAHLSIRIDPDVIRRAGKLVPDNAVYYVHTREGFAEDLARLARLSFLPAVAVRDPSDADWILSFRSRSLPRGVMELQSITLSRDLSLSRVAPH